MVQTKRLLALAPLGGRAVAKVGRYTLAVAAIAVALLVRKLLSGWIGTGGGFMLLIPAVILAATYGGLGPGLLATALGALGANYFLLNPHSLSNSVPDRNARIILFVIVCIGVDLIAAARRRVGLKLRQSESDLRLVHAELEMRIARRTTELANTNQDLLKQVAERERAEAELRRVTSQARCILWAARVVGQPGWQMDADGTGRKLKWSVRVLDEVAAQQIIPLEPVPGYNYSEALARCRNPEDDVSMARVAAKAFITRKSTYCQEFRCTDKHGEERWLCEEVHIEPAGPSSTCPDSTSIDRWNAFGLVTDITSRKHDRLERERAEKELRNISAQAHCVLWSATVEGLPGWDDPEFTGRRFGWSVRMHDEQAAQRVVALDVLPGQTYADAWYASRTPEDCARMDRTSDEALLSGAPGYGQEFPCRDRFQEIHWVLEAVSIERFGPAKWRLVGICTDITERKAAEEQRALILQEQAARAHAEAASRAKDQFLAVLSHELRTPLTAVLMAASTIEEDERIPAALRPTIAMIRRNAELEARLIDDLLDSNRITAGKVELTLEPLDAHVILRHAAEVCQSELDSKRLHLSWDLQARNHFAHGDVVRLQQVFWNLLRNAVKFTPEGGRIVVRSRDDQSVGTHPSGILSISVEDSGIGIEPAVLPRLFEAFEQGGRETTRRFGGLGLGLSISKALVDLHGGTLMAHSPGRGLGATFTVCLEAIPEPAPETMPGEPIHGEPIHGESLADDSLPRSVSGTPVALRILLVEDHDDTQRATTRFLRSLGHEVRATGCLAAARQAAINESFDLLISDLGLPDGSGLDLMREFKVGHHLRGIALSGYGMEEDLRNSRDAGFDYHLTKPVSGQQLQALLQQIASQTPTTTAV